MKPFDIGGRLTSSPYCIRRVPGKLGAHAGFDRDERRTRPVGAMCAHRKTSCVSLPLKVSKGQKAARSQRV